MNTLLRELRASIMAIVCLALVVCGIYPIVVWAISQAAFPYKANGSIVEIDGKSLGSALIGQPFQGPEYFHPRPSAAGEGYDAANSGGSNLGPISKKLIAEVAARIDHYREVNGIGTDVPIPADAVTTSGSGLDPHISLENALLQAPRVARARNMSFEDVKRKMETFTQDRQFGILGEPRVNVFLLNLALDGQISKP